MVKGGARFEVGGAQGRGGAIEEGADLVMEGLGSNEG